MKGFRLMHYFCYQSEEQFKDALKVPFRIISSTKLNAIGECKVCGVHRVATKNSKLHQKTQENNTMSKMKTPCYVCRGKGLNYMGIELTIGMIAKALQMTYAGVVNVVKRDGWKEIEKRLKTNQVRFNSNEWALKMISHL